jgi:hypothetical protein
MTNHEQALLLLCKVKDFIWLNHIEEIYKDEMLSQEQIENLFAEIRAYLINELGNDPCYKLMRN